MAIYKGSQVLVPATDQPVTYESVVPNPKLKLLLRQGYGAVYLPGALDRKYPQAPWQWGWQYVFPARDLSTDPRTGAVRCHHLDKSLRLQHALTAEEELKIHPPKAVRAGIQKSLRDNAPAAPFGFRATPACV